MKSKVLLIGPACFNYNQSIASAFDPTKFDVKVIDYAEQYGKINLINKVRYFISSTKQLTTLSLLSELNKYIIKIYRHYQPDIVLFIKGETIQSGTIEQMRNSKNILWMMDGIYYNPQSINLVNKMDAVFLFEKTDVPKVQQINSKSYYLPSAFDDKIFNDLHLKKSIDILFIGTLYKERINQISKIHHQFPDLKLKVYCERFRFYKNPVAYLMSFFDKVYVNRFVQPKKANRLYNKSRICLNMHHKQSVYGINPRFFEILGSNAQLLTDYKPFLDEYFPDNKIHVYKSDDELLRMIDEHFNKVKFSVDRNLCSTVRNEHTYKQRVEFILGKI